MFLAASQIIATKIITVFLFTVPASIFIYPFTLLLLDMIIEFFGIETSYRTIGISFITQILMVLLFWLSIVTKPSELWHLQESWVQIFNLGIRITIASWIAFLICQISNAYMFAKLKTWTERKWKKSKYPAIRSGIIDIPVLALDSIIFITFAFYGVFDIIPLILGQIVMKWIIGILDSPIISLAKKISYGSK